MSKALKSMSKEDRVKAISHRIAGKTMGLGFWSAKEAQAKMGIVQKVEVTQSKVVEDDVSNNIVSEDYLE